MKHEKVDLNKKEERPRDVHKEKKITLTTCYVMYAARTQKLVKIQEQLKTQFSYFFLALMLKDITEKHLKSTKNAEKRPKIVF